MTAILIILAALTLSLLGYGIALVLREDGYGVSAGHRPPQSRYPDVFDPSNRGLLA